MRSQRAIGAARVGLVGAARLGAILDAALKTPAWTSKGKNRASRSRRRPGRVAESFARPLGGDLAEVDLWGRIERSKELVAASPTEGGPEAAKTPEERAAERRSFKRTPSKSGSSRFCSIRWSRLRMRRRRGSRYRIVRVKVIRTDPRTPNCISTAPVHRDQVVFWRQATAPDGLPRRSMVWSARKNKVLDALAGQQAGSSGAQVPILSESRRRAGELRRRSTSPRRFVRDARGGGGRG